MFGNYLGIGNSASSSSKGQPPKYSRDQAKPDPSTKCQKCLKLGHFTYACTGQRSVPGRDKVHGMRLTG